MENPQHEPGYDRRCPDCRDKTRGYCGRAGADLPSTYTIIYLLGPGEGDITQPTWVLCESSRRFGTLEQAKRYRATIAPSRCPIVLLASRAKEVCDALNAALPPVSLGDEEREDDRCALS